MPGTASKRDKNKPHHIMSRGMLELNLFTFNEDKEYYLSLMKTASQVYRITIIPYCLILLNQGIESQCDTIRMNQKNRWV